MMGMEEATGLRGMTGRSDLPMETTQESFGQRFLGGAERLLNNITHGTGAGLSKISDALRSTSAGAAEGFQGLGRSLQNTNLREIPSQIGTMVREHPVRTALIGLGIGLLARRLFR